MSRAPIFHGRVREGRIEFQADETFQRRQYLRALDGQDVEVIVRRRQKRRSLDQNAWLWGVGIPLLADALGYDAHEHDVLHYRVLCEYFGTLYDPRSGMDVPARTSSGLTTKEFSAYMEWFVRWAAMEHHCVIPLPDESEAA